MSTPVTIINLDRVSMVIVDARKETYRLSDVAVAIDTPNVNRPDVAKLGRDLLHLADQLELAAQLVRNEYWVLKGYNDPLAEDDA